MGCTIGLNILWKRSFSWRMTQWWRWVARPIEFTKYNTMSLLCIASLDFAEPFVMPTGGGRCNNFGGEKEVRVTVRQLLLLWVSSLCPNYLQHWWHHWWSFWNDAGSKCSSKWYGQHFLFKLDCYGFDACGLCMSVLIELTTRYFLGHLRMSNCTHTHTHTAGLCHFLVCNEMFVYCQMMYGWHHDDVDAVAASTMKLSKAMHG